MTMTSDQNDFLTKNSTFINNLFNVQENKDFLLQFVTDKQFDKFVSSGNLNFDQVKKMIIFMQWEENERLYDALVDRLYEIHKGNGELLSAMMKTCVRFTNIDENTDKQMTTEVHEKSKQGNWTCDLRKEMINGMNQILSDMKTLWEENQKMHDIKSNERMIQKYLPAIEDVNSLNAEIKSLINKRDNLLHRNDQLIIEIKNKMKYLSSATAANQIPFETTCAHFITTLSTQFPLVDETPDEKWKVAKQLYTTFKAINQDLENIEAKLSITILIDLACLYHKISVYNRFVASRFKDALDYSLKELKILYIIYPDDHCNETVAECFYILGCNYCALCEYQTALEYLKKAKNIIESFDVRNDTFLAKILNRLGATYNGLTDYSSGLEYCLKALQIRQNIFQGDHIEVAISLRYVGYSYLYQQKFTLALDYANKSLSMYRRLFPNGHPQTGYALSSIAQMYEKQGNSNKYLEFCKEALKIFLQVFKDNVDLDVANELYKIGVFYKEQNSLKESLDYLTKSLEMYKQLHEEGDDEKDIADCLYHIGQVYEKQKQWNKCLEYFTLCLEIRQRLYPQGDDCVADSLTSVGITLEWLERYMEALEYHDKANTMYKKLHSMDHEMVKYSDENIKRIHLNLSRDNVNNS